MFPSITLADFELILSNLVTFLKFNVKSFKIGNHDQVI